MKYLNIACALVTIVVCIFAMINQFNMWQVATAIWAFNSLLSNLTRK